MGSYADNPETISSKRLATKLDWNVNSNHRLSISYRHTESQNYNTSASSSTRVNFYNNGVLYPNKTNSVSAELRSNFKMALPIKCYSRLLM